MRFLADMGLARSTVAFLRSQGHDAVHLRDQGLQRLPDGETIEKACLEDRIVPTRDLDFGRLLAISHSGKPSVITFRLADMRARYVDHYLAQVTARFASELEAGALVSVSEQRIRVRSLPIGAVGL